MAMTTRSRDKNVGQAGCMNKEASRAMRTASQDTIVIPTFRLHCSGKPQHAGAVDESEQVRQPALQLYKRSATAT